ncbi:hypothetical protein AVEN_109439-1 [Araneus ventricosus]|uniref:Uncharacterized protein n=1 Tax=Araneus ventricosus TaxID=182803 RepID=A0A4Y2MSE9_ARAVE|nr:hypothetical protein AVEN_109439-1 [Araneus ventricosus]
MLLRSILKNRVKAHQDASRPWSDDGGTWADTFLLELSSTHHDRMFDHHSFVDQITLGHICAVLDGIRFESVPSVQKPASTRPTSAFCFLKRVTKFTK